MKRTYICKLDSLKQQEIRINEKNSGYTFPVPETHTASGLSELFVAFTVVAFISVVLFTGLQAVHAVNPALTARTAQVK